MEYTPMELLGYALAGIVFALSLVILAAVVCVW